jgi:TonB family protein
VGGLFVQSGFGVIFAEIAMPMKNILLLLGLSAATSCWCTTAGAQGTSPTGAPAPSVFNYVEQMPQPPYDLGKYLSENIQYPDNARENNIEGRVIIRFVVNEDGHISDCAIVKSVSGDCDTEALRVIKNMPPWKPGRQNGKEVKVYYNQPISFKLEDPEPVKDTLNKKAIVTHTMSREEEDMSPDIKPTPPPAMIYTYVEQPPMAGFNLLAYIRQNLQYPEGAQRAKIEGRVIVKFVVNEDGSISDATAVRGIGAGCDEEAVRVIRNMPRWKPGTQNGKPVKVYFTQPINFKLTNGR